MNGRKYRGATLTRLFNESVEKEVGGFLSHCITLAISTKEI